MIKKIYFLVFITFIYSCKNETKEETFSKGNVTEILILGTLHFNQFHNIKSENTNFSGEKRQNEFKEVVDKLSLFNPDAIFIEREPNKQKVIDSLFNLKNLNYTSLTNGMSEAYQIGFKTAKANNLNTVYGVDYYESIPQNLFEKGNNLKIFKDSLSAFQNKGRAVTKDFLNGKNSILQFLVELNKKENIQMSNRLLFNTPAYVTNGEFKNQDKYGNVDNKYIGVEYISLFYERNLKIYSNILSTQRQTKAKKIVLIIGQVHVGVLEGILKNNPSFKVVPANEYLSK